MCFGHFYARKWLVYRKQQAYYIWLPEISVYSFKHWDVQVCIENCTAIYIVGWPMAKRELKDYGTIEKDDPYCLYKDSTFSIIFKVLGWQEDCNGFVTVDGQWASGWTGVYNRSLIKVTASMLIGLSNIGEQCLPVCKFFAVFYFWVLWWHETCIILIDLFLNTVTFRQTFRTVSVT